MRSTSSLGALFLSSILVTGCGGGGSDAATPGDAAPQDATSGDGGGGADQLPCGVEAVLAGWASPPKDPSITSCRSCHGATPSFGAPMSLVTYADLVAPSTKDPSKKVYQRVAARVHDDALPMPPIPNPRLTTAELSTLDAWVAAGAPARAAGVTCDTPDVGTTDAAPKPLSCTPDTELRPATAWTMPTDKNDIYTCYGIDVPITGKRQITAIVPKIDNTKIVHHVLLMQSDTAVDPTPKPCSGSAITQYRLLYGWAPGGPPFELPKEAGFPAEGTMHYVVQIHYNNLKHLAGETDRSGFDFCTTDVLRPNAADVLAFGSVSFSIPPRGSLDLVCNLPVSALPPMHVFGAFPHMHQLGKRVSTVLHRKSDGATVDLGSVSAWDFNTQLWYPLPDTIVSPGDTVTTNCVWDNPGDSAVKFGENTTDEMCYSFTLYYPKIALPKWSWTLPAALATCAPR